MGIFSVREIRTLEQVAQRSCRVSILGDAQNSICHSPKQPALAGGLDEMISRSPFQPQSLCDSMKMTVSFAAQELHRLSHKANYTM